ncbi:hypothetical protein [Streptomyces sp. NPDC058572]|uniref:hypothetical protein n=1 Tax=Streptomyces sp. NPDC058572 TaxID=3346546 RepID=UPI0036666F91
MQRLSSSAHRPAPRPAGVNRVVISAPPASVPIDKAPVVSAEPALAARPAAHRV